MHTLLIDFSKTFDRIPHGLLLNIHYYGLPTTESHASYETEHSMWSVEGCVSDSVPVVRGVPQGSVLCLLLFLLLINDLPDKINSRTRLFADGCIVYRPIRSAADCAILQQDFYTLAKWETEWGMEFHSKNVLSISRPRSNTIKYPCALK